MATDITDAVHAACLWLPDAEVFTSHGVPNFRAKGGKVFAIYAVNHHGDGHVALWLNAPPGAQAAHVRDAPKHFFVPPYVGPRGWLGVRLDSGLAWSRIVALVREAYVQSSPAKCVARIGKAPVIATPTKALAPETIDPVASPRGQLVMKTVRAIVDGWPDVTEGTQFGHPVWRAGKRVFLSVYAYERMTLGAWVGIDQQGLMLDDPRYTIPKYTGHIGWIALDVSKRLDRDEVRALARASYRHFALKRMRDALDRLA